MKNIKTKCQWCGSEIPGTEEYYARFGNICMFCNSYCTRASFREKNQEHIDRDIAHSKIIDRAKKNKFIK